MATDVQPPTKGAIGKVLGALCILIFIAAAVYSYISPQLTIRAIREAARSGDTDRLRDFIDFDSVRNGLKDDFKAMMMRQAAGPQLTNNPFAALGVAIAGALIDPIIDTLVSPASLAQMFSQGQVEPNHSLHAGPSPQKPPAAARGGNPDNQDRATSAPVEQDVVVTQGYDGYSRYRITLRPVGATPDEQIGFILRRQGLFTWKLSRVLLPRALLTANTEPAPNGTSNAPSPPQNGPDFLASYTAYMMRQETSEAILALNPVRAKITEFVASGDLKDADVQGLTISSPLISSISLDRTKQVVVAELSGDLEGHTLGLAFTVGSDGRVYWTCGSIDLRKDYLPSACRGDIAYSKPLSTSAPPQMWGTPLESTGSVRVIQGNVYYQASADQPPRQLTVSRNDSEASLSPDRRLVAFVRTTPGKHIDTGSGESPVTDLWVATTDGTQARRVLAARANDNMKQVLAGFRTPRFSPDGRKLYFLSAAWATSAAVHVLDLQSGLEHFVCAGNSLDIVKAGRYMGDLLVEQHRYHDEGGSYDEVWLLSPDGHQIDRVGYPGSADFEARLAKITGATQATRY